jgi:integrase
LTERKLTGIGCCDHIPGAEQSRKGKMSREQSDFLVEQNEDHEINFDHSSPRFESDDHSSILVESLGRSTYTFLSSPVKMHLASRDGLHAAKPATASVLDANMDFALFVETKFVPEHVAYKTTSGRTHYQAILKHLLRPDTVDRIFGRRDTSRSRLKALDNWPYLDHVPLCEIRVDHVRKIVYAAANAGYSSQTVKHIKNVIGAIITHAQSENCYSRINPASQLRLSPVRHAGRDVLTPRQITDILERMQFPEREIALIAMYTGLTITQICSLQWEHVNFGRSPVFGTESIPPMTLAIRKGWNNMNIVDRVHIRAKHIPLPTALLPTLMSLKERAGDCDPNQFVFLSASGSPFLPSSIRVGRLKPIGRRLGIPWLSWHDLRRVHKRLSAGSIGEIGGLSEEASSSIPPPLPSSDLPRPVPVGRNRSMCRSFSRSFDPLLIDNNNAD